MLTEPSWSQGVCGLGSPSKVAELSVYSDQEGSLVQCQGVTHSRRQRRVLHCTSAGCEGFVAHPALWGLHVTYAP